MQKEFAEIISKIGEDGQREGLARTPERASEAFRYLTRGYRQSLEEIVNGALFASEVSEMVVVRSIEFFSLCEHHILPFFGKCHVAYVPAGQLIGLSKIPRIVDMYASRLQIQEKLTMEVAEAVQKVTKSRGAGVVIEAQHLCMMMRGVQKQNSALRTSAMLGVFRDSQNTRTEFLHLLR